jgi:hypothetical protein
MPETTDNELERLQRRADAAGCYVNRHRAWDPLRGNGDLWLQWKRRTRDDRAPELHLLSYSTAAQVADALAEIEAQPTSTRRCDMRLSFRVLGKMRARERSDTIH